MSAVKWILSIFLILSVLIVTIFGINCVYGYLFPIKFQDEVAAASKESGLDESVIYSVINIESRFNKNAVSPKGAVGLMQVMPSTAQEMSKILSNDAKGYLESKSFEKNLRGTDEKREFSIEGTDKIFDGGETASNPNDDKDFSENLKEPAINIMLGAKYLKSLLLRFENLDTALCAYNAGPSTVKSWLTNKEFSKDGKTLLHIPYEETKNYIEKFHKNLKYYSVKIR